jgi:hypothetical protein
MLAEMCAMSFGRGEMPWKSYKGQQTWFDAQL